MSRDRDSVRGGGTGRPTRLVFAGPTAPLFKQPFSTVDAVRLCLWLFMLLEFTQALEGLIRNGAKGQGKNAIPLT